MSYNKKYMDEYRKRPYAIEAQRKFRMEQHPHKVWFTNKKFGALREGIKFELKPEDVPWPDVCPILGIPIKRTPGAAGDGSPSLDRINPALGYVVGNVRVISHRANTLKSNCTSPREALAIARDVMANSQEPTWLRTPREMMSV
jgi:hypothetical protein